MSWTLLILAGLCEILWAVGLKFTDSFTRPLPTLLTILSLVASLILLEAALRQIPLGTAYAVWVGVGAVGTALVGIVLFGESAAPAKLVSLVVIVIGLVGLNLTAA